MDTSWWPAAVAVVAIVLLVLLPRPAVRGAVRPRGPGSATRARPGEVWCLTDGRSCLVLAVGARGRARVAWITGKYDDRRAGVIPLPPGAGGRPGRTGYLEADRPAEVSSAEFDRRLGMLDPTVWDEVRGLGGGHG
ncbi:MULTISPECIES: hypothetical protein [unclassified Streptomyces]|uniref:hypothetical protein n=1 Tax=unclassified Streptomyces TaxID=2593676 RepID=UPI00109EDDAD|nr:hypothetical protein [Streptomyces sp. A1136]THA53853.1 hypothetical protein E6R62_17675 [Streptomyces sp. A1136]